MRREEKEVKEVGMVEGKRCGMPRREPWLEDKGLRNPTEGGKKVEYKS